jgi:hypothetical protein
MRRAVAAPRRSRGASGAQASLINADNELDGAEPIEQATHPRCVWANDTHANFQILPEPGTGNVRAANERDARVGHEHLGVDVYRWITRLRSRRSIALEWHRSAGQLVA